MNAVLQDIHLILNMQNCVINFVSVIEENFMDHHNHHDDAETQKKNISILDVD